MSDFQFLPPSCGHNGTDAILHGRDVAQFQWIVGTDLPLELQREAKAMFVHRFTGDHVPAYAARKAHNNMGSGYLPVQFASDADWLANTRFALTKSGRLSKRAPSRSTPTWPSGRGFQSRPFAEAIQ